MSAPLPPLTETAPASETEDAAVFAALAVELSSLRALVKASDAAHRASIDAVVPAHRASAVNLAHYIGLRQCDLRLLQARLTALGLSSLGRSETDVLANLDRVLGLLQRLLPTTVPPLADSAWSPQGADGRARLLDNAQALFGAPSARRQVRIMVTLPGSAAHDSALVQALVTAGMDIARINCAHDSATQWRAMAQAVRSAAAAAGRSVRVLMDLGGPKLRTSGVLGSPPALHLKPVKDELGRVTQPVLLGLRPRGSTLPVPGADTCLGADEAWLQGLEPGARVRLTDARGTRRKLEVRELQPGAALLVAARGMVLAPQTVLQARRKGLPDLETRLSGWPATGPGLRLRRDDRLWVLQAPNRLDPALQQAAGRDSAGHGLEQPGQAGEGLAGLPRIGCTLPRALQQAQPGHRIWFDDGRLGGVVEAVSPEGLLVRITHAVEGGDRLQADKGINLPDTPLVLPALTDKDLEDLDTAVEIADLVGLSFTQCAADVQALQSHLARRDARQLGLLLKIETRRGFENLPDILMAAMASPHAGVMIARGDLAVECGWERLAEVQEEILWACEAAHMPVVWATQVLENLAKTGFPSRAEITDAAMGERAECVMLNKGPHILDAMRTLDDILRRMQEHQSKKRPLLRALKAWSCAGTQVPQGPAAAETATDHAAPGRSSHRSPTSQATERV